MAANLYTVGEFNNMFGRNATEVFNNSAEYEAMLPFQKIFRVEDTDQQQNKHSSYVNNGQAETVGELGPVPVVGVLKGYETITTNFDIKDRIVISDEWRQSKKDPVAIERHVESEAQNAMQAYYEKLTRDAFGILNGAFTSTITPDGELFASTNHTFVDGGNVFSNILTTTTVDDTLLREIDARGRTFKDNRGIPMPFMGKTIVCAAGSDAFYEFEKLVKANSANGYQYLTPQTSSDVNMFVGNRFSLITSEYLTDNDKFFVLPEFGGRRKNPLYVGMYTRPRMISDFVTNTDNASYEAVIAGYQQLGVVDVPYSILCGQLA